MLELDKNCSTITQKLNKNEKFIRNRVRFFILERG